jgi:glycosyltransferase involved in cell wall biosynthesis
MKVSVIIPSHGNAVFLPDVVESLQCQTFLPHEIIIVHSGPHDPPKLTSSNNGIKAFLIRVREQLNAGEARNRGVEQVSGDMLAFLDNDVIPDHQWLDVIIKRYKSTPGNCILGSVSYSQPGGYWGMARWFIEFGAIHPGMPNRFVTRHGASCNMALMLKDFYRVSCFETNFYAAEDKMLFSKLRKAGCKTYFDSDAVVYHKNIHGFLPFLRHLFLLGKWSAASAKIGEGCGQIAIKIPLISFTFWLYRAFAIWGRTCFAKGGEKVKCIALFPGILPGLIVWNSGFVFGVFKNEL